MIGENKKHLHYAKIIFQFLVKTRIKRERWEHIREMAYDETIPEEGLSEREKAAILIGIDLLDIQDKKQACEILHELAHDRDESVRESVAKSLGNVFFYIPDKKQACEDLISLVNDVDSEVRLSANYSLGRVSIFKATEAENEKNFRKHLRKALEFFENSAKEAKKAYSYNPARFCLPFYRSFYMITSENSEVRTEVQKYLDEAKSAIEGSKSKEKLLQAVENLANALSEAQRAKNFEEMICNLSTYRQFCESAADLLDTTEDEAPGATKLIRKGLPIIDEKIKDILEEIKERANIACQQSKGTKAEEIACAANREVQKWQIGDLEQMTQNVENLIFVLSSKVPSAPEFKYIHNEIEKIRMEPDITKQYQKISYIIALIPTSVHIGDNINQNVSGNNNQIIGKGNENKNNGEKLSTVSSKQFKKSIIDWINPPATIAAFVGFISVEIGTYYYPISYNHIIGVFIALLVFIIVAIFNKS